LSWLVDLFFNDLQRLPSSSPAYPCHTSVTLNLGKAQYRPHDKVFSIPLPIA